MLGNQASSTPSHIGGEQGIVERSVVLNPHSNNWGCSRPPDPQPGYRQRGGLLATGMWTVSITGQRILAN